MAFQRFAPSPRLAKNELVVSVGSRAFVNWIPPRGAADPGVPLRDGTGAHLGNDLRDGEEVEILSWLPRAREGLSYQVRRLRDGKEWWIAATYLRRGAVAQPPPLVASQPAGSR
ncbi:MAG: hypothetical protein U0802_16740 [Candidatus Binatia bacterium]